MDPTDRYIFIKSIHRHLLSYSTCYDEGFENHRYCCIHKFKESLDPFTDCDNNYYNGPYCWEFTLNNSRMPVKVNCDYCCLHKKKPGIYPHGRNDLIKNISVMSESDLRSVLLEMIGIYNY